MINRVVSAKEVKELAELLSESYRVVITCHVSPDGDAIGSSLGLYHLLTDLGKDVKVVTPDAPLQSLKFLESWKEIVPYSRYTEFGNKLLNSADLIFCLDFNALYRVDKMADALRMSPAHKVMIDHHLDAEQFCDVTISYP
ncbi:MAG: DHH family phosphoesterase, partial [Muribaculaceae bacterium]|nr:DHH family phosphoesterase [Muribaculaceae bacterium]